MIITNFKNLAKSPLRKKALQIVEAGYEEINIQKVIGERIMLNGNKLIIKSASINGSRNLSLNLEKYKRIFVIGIGKGSALASGALVDILGKRLMEGIAIDVMKLKTWNLKLKTFTGTHPVPSLKNIKATKKIIELAEKAGKDDLIISFICGGGSALLCGSEKEFKASREIFNKLTNIGVNIIELNTIRKHLSEVKGGGLAKIAYPASVISLIVADVPLSFKNDLPRGKTESFLRGLSMVASGPTIYDKTTKKDAEKIIRKYQYKEVRLPNIDIVNFWKSDFQKLIHALRETPKDKKYFKKVKNILFISNREPIAAMVKKAKKLGFSAKVYSYNLKGEAKNSLNSLISLLSRGKVPGAVLAGGETTIILGKNLGKGGRNMEAVLGAINKVSSFSLKADSPRAGKFQASKMVFISFASDGRDNTEAAGAIGDILTISKAGKSKLDFEKYLKNHNTFEFFKKTGDLIFADKKTFNVSDLILVLSSSKE